MLKLCLVAAICATGQGKLTTESYDSIAEGRKISFQVALPPSYDETKKYPLFVQMFGDAKMLPSEKRPYIRIRPSGRGVWGYRSMSRYDVLESIKRTKHVYSVDGDRVYITGTSAGATGIMHVVAQRPDIFAAAIPLVAFGNDLPLANFRNLPLQCEHGVHDWTSAICNVRVQFTKLNRLGIASAKLNEHQSAGHGIRRPPASTMKWLMSQKRNNQPQHITYTCEHPRDGKAYWLRILEFADPHQSADVDASFRDRLFIRTQNIKTLKIDLDSSPVSKNRRIRIDETAITFPGSQSSFTLGNRGGKWVVSQSSPKPDRRPYGAGAAANLFQGDSVIIT